MKTINIQQALSYPHYVGNLQGPDGSRCAVGAIISGLMGDDRALSTMVMPNSDVAICTEETRIAIDWLIEIGMPLSAIAMHNDNLDTTNTERDLLRRAMIERLISNGHAVAADSDTELAKELNAKLCNV